MIYGYIRVSTDRQTVENQRHEVSAFAIKRGMPIAEWIEETMSGLKNYDKGEFGKLVTKLSKGDILIVSELSRMSRTLFDIMSILKICMDKDVSVFSVKENYELGNNISSKVLAFAFGLAAEIERNLISQRTKDALARLKAEGVILGRPKGSIQKIKKLDSRLDEIRGYLLTKHSVCQIARNMKVHRMTVTATIKQHNLRHELKPL